MNPAGTLLMTPMSAVTTKGQVKPSIATHFNFRFGAEAATPGGNQSVVVLGGEPPRIGQISHPKPARGSPSSLHKPLRPDIGHSPTRGAYDAPPKFAFPLSA